MKKKFFSHNIFFNSQLDTLNHYIYSKNQNVLVGLAFEPNLHPEIQKAIFKINQSLKNEFVDINLSINNDLIPELFRELFEICKEEILQEYKLGFRYKNQETQELLEKYLLLI